MKLKTNLTTFIQLLRPKIIKNKIKVLRNHQQLPMIF
jgi:hypothetical protein